LQIDPKGTGAIEAMTAAKFLKKSGLSDVVLSRIWDLSDPSGKGFLDKPGFFVALKLVSLSQAGQVASMANIYLDIANPPKLVSNRNFARNGQDEIYYINVAPIARVNYQKRCRRVFRLFPLLAAEWQTETGPSG